jgi:NADPH:quinone reductase-like Zn-dependent oxidoreductase
MKAVVHSEFGPPDVLALAELAKPTPNASEVLVRVRAAAANPLDWHFIRGEPGVMRLMGRPKNRIPGADFAGEIESVGTSVTEFRAGDQVFGTANGTFAVQIAKALGANVTGVCSAGARGRRHRPRHRRQPDAQARASGRSRPLHRGRASTRQGRRHPVACEH